MAEPIDNSFAQVLGEVRKGALLQELSEQLAEVVAAVRATGKPGKLKLTLTVDPVKGAKGEQVMLFDDVAATIPKDPKQGSYFFPTEENGLSRKHPRQRDWVEEAEERAAQPTTQTPPPRAANS